MTSTVEGEASPGTETYALRGGRGTRPTTRRVPSFTQSAVRAVWVQSLQDETHESIEKLAEVNRLHPESFARRSGWRFSRRTLRERFWQAAARPVTIMIPQLLPLQWTNSELISRDLDGDQRAPGFLPLSNPNHRTVGETRRPTTCLYETLSPSGWQS